MKKKGNWSPARGLGGIKATRKPIINLFSGKLGSQKAWENADQIVTGFLGGSGFFLFGANGCDKPELGLGVGLGAVGLSWLLTGYNYMAISGAISTLSAYGICKWLNKSFEVEIAPGVKVNSSDFVR